MFLGMGFLVLALLVIQSLFLTNKPATATELLSGAFCIFLAAKMYAVYAKTRRKEPLSAQLVLREFCDPKLVIIVFLCLVTVYAINAISLQQFVIVRGLKVALLFFILFILFSKERYLDFMPCFVRWFCPWLRLSSRWKPNTCHLF